MFKIEHHFCSIRAGPLFFESSQDRIENTDGVYVETIITNGGTQGFMSTLGQANFFPNYGQSQPGCGLDVHGGCAHARTVLLYAESINSVFTAYECGFNDISAERCSTSAHRTARMGGPNGNIGLTSNWWLPTNGAQPFSQG